MRAAVLRATLEELAEGDYASFSVEAVARRAGVNKTTVYRRWRTRENLVLEAMLELGSERVPIPDTGSLEQDLFAYGHAIATSATAPEVQAIVRAGASIQDPDSPIVDASRRFWQARFELAGQMVQRAIDRGEVPAGTDPRLVVETIVAPLYFRLLMSRQPLSAGHVRELAAFVARAVRSAGSPP